jgi:8-amino-7-oxononanoate synthase
MIDFASAAYLGFPHRREDLAAWSNWPRLTLGKPQGLAESSAARHLAQGLARLTGLEDAVLGASTLHLFWDLFAVIEWMRPSVYLVDAGLYPIARWGLERARARVLPFPRHDVESLTRLLSLHQTRRPVVVCDGWSPVAGKPAPLADYQRVSARAGGLVLVDDTQALGILGERPEPSLPWGRGGGASVRHQRLAGCNVVWVASLAKAFSAPLAALLGPKEILNAFRDRALTRVHCSGPSEASIAAGLAALRWNAKDGELRRLSLASRIREFRGALRQLSIPVAGGFFPYQTVLVDKAEAAHGYLMQRGIEAVLHRPAAKVPACLSFLLRADQRAEDIQRCAQALGNWQESQRRDRYVRRAV